MKDVEGRFTFCVAAIIENQDNEILLLKRAPDNIPADIWDVVGGGVEQFEDPFDGLNREIIEETGIKDFDIIKAIDVFHWFQEDGSFNMIGMTFWCKTKSVDIKLSHEHSEFVWKLPVKALELAEHPTVISSITNYIKERKRLNL